MYPLFLRMTDRLAVVIGGGAVGRRKAAALLAGGAKVRLVCLEARPADETSPALEWKAEPYHVRHLVGAELVLACATAEVNRVVVADARARGMWVCSASEPGQGDFLTAAVIRRGDLTVALGSGGAAPALTRAVRHRLEALLDAELAPWLGLLAELRPIVRARVSDDGKRRDLWEQLCDDSWVARLRVEGVEAVRGAMLALVSESAGGL